MKGTGFSDVVVGSSIYDNGQIDEGRVFVYYGSVSGVNTIADWTAESNQTGAQIGGSVGTAGGCKWGHYADIIVSAYQYDNGETDEGKVFVYFGSATGLSISPDWSAEGNQAEAYFGLASGTAGDINGDGFADVLIGVSLYDDGQTNEGRAYLFQGSAAGLSLTPNWTAESNQANAQFGYAVGSAGDVNGRRCWGYLSKFILFDGLLDDAAFVTSVRQDGFFETANWTGYSQGGCLFGHVGYQPAI